MYYAIVAIEHAGYVFYRALVSAVSILIIKTCSGYDSLHTFT